MPSAKMITKIFVYSLLSVGIAGSAAQAEPKPISAAPVAAPPSGVKGGQASIIAVAHIPVSVNVVNGDIWRIIQAVSTRVKQPLIVDVRFVPDYKVSLTTTNMPIEDVLRAAAAFGHCNLYILHNKFLMTSPNLLKDAEKDEIRQKDKS